MVREVATGEVDRHRNPIKRKLAPFPVLVYAVEPATKRDEATQDRPEALVEGWNLYAPVDADFERGDEVTLPYGEKGTVVVPPSRWRDNPYGDRQHGAVVFVERTQG